MLSLIAAQTIVSSGTLRPDHLCEALISEADRLGIMLDRDLWQPAAAIAAHGRKPGSAFCLDLPTRLMEISSEIVGELFEALNWAAPDGCYLGPSEGDGALFLWTLTLEAQAEAINSEPNGRWEAKTLDIPEHWLSAIINGDESSFDYYDDKRDYKHYEQFVAGELSDGWNIATYEEEGDFRAYHDASPYGVLACDTVTVLAMRQKSQA